MLGLLFLSFLQENALGGMANSSGQAAAHQNLSCADTVNQHRGGKQDQEVLDQFCHPSPPSSPQFRAQCWHFSATALHPWISTVTPQVALFFYL